jgi:hypothetical protein
MPNWFPSWTKCSTPATWGKPPYVPMALGAILVGGGGWLMTVLIGGVWTPGIAFFLATVVMSAIMFCNWWLNIRLICLGGDRSAMGAIYHLEPPVPSYDPTNPDAFFSAFDTDYSFNLLLWNFTPRNQLPKSFVDNQATAGAFAQLATDWPSIQGSLVPTNVPFSEVSDEVGLIVQQQAVATRGLGLTGENAEAPDNVLLPGGSGQHFMLHCEIEGPGMHDLLILLWAMFATLLAATFVYAIPVVGPIISLILLLLALLGFAVGMPAVMNDEATPPSGFGGSFNPYEPGNDPKAPVDLAYCYGRWVYDSLHSGGNELHPIHYMVKVGEATHGDIGNGIWPGDAGVIQIKLDAAFAIINDPTTPGIQARPENQWTVHPLLDGCRGETPYPEPQPPGPPIV